MTNYLNRHISFVKPLPTIVRPRCSGVVLIIAGLALGWLIIDSGWDIALREQLSAMAGGRTAFWGWVTVLGEGWVQLLGCWAVAALMALRGAVFDRWLWLWAGPLSLLVGGLNQLFFKIPLGRPRPKLYPEFYHFEWFEFDGALRGFPSGHTITTFFIAGFVWRFYPAWRWPLLLVAGIIGFSRIPMQAHWPADVVAGMFVGFGVGLWLAQSAVRHKKERNTQINNQSREKPRHVR